MKKSIMLFIALLSIKSVMATKDVEMDFMSIAIDVRLNENILNKEDVSKVIDEKLKSDSIIDNPIDKEKVKESLIKLLQFESIVTEKLKNEFDQNVQQATSITETTTELTQYLQEADEENQKLSGDFINGIIKLYNVLYNKKCTEENYNTILKDFNLKLENNNIDNNIGYEDFNDALIQNNSSIFDNFVEIVKQLQDDNRLKKTTIVDLQENIQSLCKSFDINNSTEESSNEQGSIDENNVTNINEYLKGQVNNIKNSLLEKDQKIDELQNKIIDKTAEDIKNTTESINKISEESRKRFEEVTNAANEVLNKYRSRKARNKIN